MRLASLVVIAACANPPPAREPEPPPDQAIPVPSAAVPAGPALPPPPPVGGTAMPPPPAQAEKPVVAPAPPPPAAASAAGLPIAMGAARADVRAAFGTADPTGPGFDTFGSKGLVIGYHKDEVDSIAATTLAVGTTYRERVLGVAIGETEAHASATWGPPVSTKPGLGGDYDQATYQTGAYRVTVEIWTKDADQGGGFGKVRARTIKRIEVQKR